MKRLILMLAAIALMVPVGVSAQNLETVRDREAHPPIHIRGSAKAAPFAYSPQNMQQASPYGFGAIYTQTKGTGQVIAIIDAYDDPTIANDLQTFVAQYGGPIHTSGCTVNAGPHPCFQKIYAQNKPRTNGGWALEIALDVEWAHAMAPGADILLVEATSSSLSNLLSAVAKATNGTYPGVHVVSMSWGAGEFSSETAYDSYFTTPNVMFVAASGDSGPPTWPAASPNVVGAGGTMFSSVVNNAACSPESTTADPAECAWNDSYIGYSYSGGGGPSSVELKPSYQSGLQSNAHRGVPDIAYFADINPGYSVYDSTPDNGQTGWFAVGGTSAASPQWAAIFALVDALRACGAAGRCLPLGAQSPTPLYTVAAAHYGAAYNDVTQGSNSNGQSAGPGYDFVTGIGSPQIYNLVNYLVALP